jgi:putative ABC transport system permease protein
MRFLNRLLARATNFTMRRHSDRRLREEMEEHLALQTEENLRLGMTPAEARRQAVLKFGAVEAVWEHCHAEQGLPFLEHLLQDLRFALRLLSKSPGFAAVAILTTALGIGATTAIFSVVDATLLHPLPYPHPEELMRVEDHLQSVGAQSVGMSVPEWRDLAHSGIFQYVALVLSGPANLTGSAEPVRLQWESVSPNYLSLLGVKPELGRLFNPDDQTPGFNLEVVISDGLWKREFGGDPQILGKNLRLDNDVYHVVGVMPPGFRDPGRTLDQRNTEMWGACGFATSPPNRSRRAHFDVVARLKPGLTLTTAQSQLDALVSNLQTQYPGDYPVQSGWTVRLGPLKESLVGNVRLSLIMLLGAVGLVLLIACVNVANLLLARASARGREIAVRQALGATRTRLVRQLLIESLLLSMIGGAAGLVVLFCTKGLLLKLVPESLPRFSDVSANWKVLLFAVAASCIAGVIFGLAPALQAGRLHLTDTLRQEGRGSRGSAKQTRIRRALVVMEFALSLVLMIGAGLLLRSFGDLLKVPLGFNPEHVMSVQTPLPDPNDPATDIYGTPAQEAPLLRELLRRSSSLPGVQEAALGSSAAIPLNHDRNLYPLIVEGRDTRFDQPPIVERADVTPGYFHLMEIPLDRGRLFSDTDSETAPQVAVVNEALARSYWQKEDPIGKRFKMIQGRGRASTGPGWITVVGIVADARTESLTQASVPQFYLCAYQTADRDLAIFLRGQLDTGAIPAQVREQVQSVNRELPVYEAQTLDDVLSASLSERRFSLQMVASFALTALLLAGLGIYGTISYAVNDQTHDIGIRLALGASRRQISAMVLQQGLVPAMAGAAVGLASALVASRLIAGLLYGVSPTDPVTFVAVTLVLTAVALAACYIPARRAMRLDPLVALRNA